MKRFLFISICIVNILAAFICYRLYGGAKNDPAKIKIYKYVRQQDSLRDAKESEMAYESIITHIQESEGELIGNYMKWTSILVEVLTVLLTIIILLNELKHAREIEKIKRDVEVFRTSISEKILNLTLDQNNKFENSIKDIDLKHSKFSEKIQTAFRDFEATFTEKILNLTAEQGKNFENYKNESANLFDKFGVEFRRYASEFDSIIDDVKKESNIYKELSKSLEKEMRYTSESSVKTFSALLYFANIYHDIGILNFFNRQRHLSNLYAPDPKVRFSAISFLSAKGTPKEDIPLLEKIALDNYETNENRRFAVTAIVEIGARRNKINL